MSIDPEDIEENIRECLEGVEDIKKDIEHNADEVRDISNDMSELRMDVSNLIGKVDLVSRMFYTVYADTLKQHVEDDKKDAS